MATGSVLGGTSKRKLEEAYANGYNAGFNAYMGLTDSKVYKASGTNDYLQGKMVPVSKATKEVIDNGTACYAHQYYGVLGYSWTDQGNGTTYYIWKCSKCSLRTTSTSSASAKKSANALHYSTVKPSSSSEIAGYVI